jgi:hypothetical protein
VLKIRGIQLQEEPVGLRWRQEYYFWMSKRHVDSVWHKALLHKLLQRGCDIFLARLMFSFIKGRFSQVSVGSVKSSVNNVPFEVSQGAILSPTLYNIFTATFADDTAIFVSGQTPLLVQSLIIARNGKFKSTRQKRKQSTFLDAPKTFIKLK